MRVGAGRIFTLPLQVDSVFNDSTMLLLSYTLHHFQVNVHIILYIIKAVQDNNYHYKQLCLLYQLQVTGERVKWDNGCKNFCCINYAVHVLTCTESNFMSSVKAQYCMYYLLYELHPFSITC